MALTARRTGVLIGGALAAAATRKVFSTPQRPSWPPPDDAVTADGAQAATEAFVARPKTRPRDATLEFAWSTAAELDPWPEGKNFFPRILADVEAARSSVHILMFGWREDEIGMRMARLLEHKLAEGVEVRIIVDGLGSRAYWNARKMYTGLADAGAQIVVNDILPLDRDGLYPNGRIDWRHDEAGRADHRKLYVIDGTAIWTGGAGLEDHFHNGRFHDVMVRVTGAVVRQAQAAFLTSFSAHGAPLEGDLSRLFPVQPDPGTTPVVIAQVIPGGFVAASQAVRAQIDGAQERLDIMNPYFTDADIVRRVLEAARRGVKVRIVVAEKSNSAQATAVLRHHYPAIAAAGAEVFELPDCVVHAKLIIADDVVSFGTVNLDAWALYRNSEFLMTARSPELAALMLERIFEPDIARCRMGEALSGRAARLNGALCNRIAYFL